MRFLVVRLAFSARAHCIRAELDAVLDGAICSFFSILPLFKGAPYFGNKASDVDVLQRLE